MIHKSVVTLLGGLSLLSATVAQASAAQSLSLSNNTSISRAASDSGSSNQAIGNAGGYLLVAIVAGFAIWGLVELVNDNDDPDSP